MGVTLHVKPTATWVAQQTIKFLDYAQEQKLPLKTVSRDNDYLYRWFDKILEARGVESRRLAIRAPNTNAYVERFVQSLQVECLDHFLVCGEKHLDYLVREYVEHYHTERPHQSVGNRTIAERAPPAGASSGLPANCIVRKTRLGGLLSHYHHAA